MIALAQQSNIVDFPTVAPQGKSNEWYTPVRYIEAARLVMGSIDLDPASCELANQTVKATHYYTKEDDGLSKEWYGNVWLNPPYIGGLGDWIIRLLQQYHSGNVQQAIILYPTAQGALSTRWFHSLLDYPICILKKRIVFNTESSYVPMQPSFSSVFTYLGPNEARFIEVFSQFGRIAKAIDTPKQQEVTPSLWEVK